MTKKIFLFLVPFIITTTAIVGYFKLTQKISNISIPNLPTVSFSDLVKFSRFSLEKAPSQSLVGKIISMSGDIEYEKRLATQSAKISSPIDIQQGESLSTGTDGKIILSFDKTVEVYILSDTTVNVIQTLPLDIVFNQTSGISQYKKLADIPVTIRSHHLLIENKGDITVSIDKIKPIISVTINSGSVTIAYNNLGNISKVLTVDEGKTIIFNDTTRKVTVK